MAIKSVRFHVLNVGQGACNYIEIFDDKDTLIYNILIDLGTLRGYSLSARNINWLNKEIGNKTPIGIDLVILTHADADHFGLLQELKVGLGEANKNRIGMVRYGNASFYYKLKTSKRRPEANAITFLTNYTNNIAPYELHFSGFKSEGKKWDPIWASADGQVKMQLIIVNVTNINMSPSNLSRVETEDIDKNSKLVNMESLVSALVWNDCCFVTTGDADDITIEAINQLFDDGATRLPRCLLMTLPHHGARGSIYDIKKASSKITSTESVDTFVGIFKPQTLSISANINVGFRHPYVDVITQFSQFLSPIPYWPDQGKVGAEKNHYLSAYYLKSIARFGETDWPSDASYMTTQTPTNVYSTRYFLPNFYNMKIVPPETETVEQPKKIQKIDPPPLYRRYVYPPSPAVLRTDKEWEVVKGVPEFHNWTFSADVNGLLRVDDKPDTASPFVKKGSDLVFTAASRAASSSVLGPGLRPSATPTRGERATRGATRPTSVGRGVSFPGLKSLRPIA